ncbi:glucoamylase family protein [Aquisphaera insulae]|uniref:glucoamylase family protein n=1 Tax=Aquisphaera insulae TaxID=2712864 RepID=UPI00196A8AA1|nr:glucoamylase family protein [Aquisphaera insulae]
MGSASGQVRGGSPRPSRLTAEDRAELRQYAVATWRSFERMTFPSGLPADGLNRDGAGWGTPTLQTSPTNIGAYLWSIIAAERLKLISREEALARTERTLDTLAMIDRHHGFYINDIDPRTGGAVKISIHDATPRRPLVSCVDNGWLAASLVMVSNARPALRPKAQKLLDPMNFGFFFDPYNAADPINHPGLLRVAYWADDRSFYGHYGMLNSEARISSYLGISRRDLPEDHYFRLYRTLPASLGEQAQKPVGQFREYMSVKVFEGAYTYRGSRIVPSWGGSMFEALMVTLFVPEDVWGPRSWGVNHPLYVNAQIQHGIEEARYGFWGFSPANCPRGGYEVYGVKALGTDPLGYLSFDIGAPRLPSSPAASPTKHGVVTPHASFLALRYAPRESMDNLRKLAASFPIYSQFGFLDSVDVGSGIVSGGVLALDQGMIMAAIANELADDAMQHAFSDGPIEEAIRPIIALEEFSSGRIDTPIASGARPRVPAELTAHSR